MLRVVRILAVQDIKFLLVQPVKRGGLWELPGGKVKRKRPETDFGAAKRELYEEANVLLLEGTVIYQRTDEDVIAITCFLATSFISAHTKINEPDEIKAVGWFSLPEIYQQQMALTPATQRMIIRYHWRLRRQP